MDSFFGPMMPTPTRREMRDIDRVLDPFTSSLVPTLQMPVMQQTTTAMDIIESPGAFTVTADAPGFAPEDIKVELDDNRITISARKDQEKKEERDGKVVRRERQFASFSRSFTLPDNIKTDDISASLDKGVLHVTLPKAEPQPKPQPKRITLMAHEGAVEEQVHGGTGMGHRPLVEGAKQGDVVSHDVPVGDVPAHDVPVEPEQAQEGQQ